MKSRWYILFSLFISIFVSLSLVAQSPKEIVRWKSHSMQVEIIRDLYGIPHIYGKTDADAVFGLLYAQCEDDFKRVELNYIEKLGRLAEIQGESKLYADLYTRLIIDSAAAIKDFKKSPDWLKKLMIAFADGINYYLYTHPSVKPLLLTHFEPWYPLLWTDGSIGAISTGDIDETDVQNFYSGGPMISSVIKPEKEFTGSNGFAIAPSKSESGHAMLYINPHVTFYFRPEVHVVSEEGLNVYGAVTWGQFFIYQGFNAHCGWMHTSCNVDVADVYKEKVVNKKDKFYYLYDQASKKINEKVIHLRYRIGEKINTKSIRTFSTHHGPIMGTRDKQWVSVRSNNRSLDGLKQSWLRTKATGFDDYKRIMDLKSNISNNTVYADAQGHIAYWHGNFIPKRDPKLNWSKAVDGSTSATAWQGLHSVEESVHRYDPAVGWLQNCNSTPFTVAGWDSPDKSKYPSYMAPDGENFRGVNAVRVLSAQPKFNLNQIISAGYDTYLPAFEILIPALIKSFEAYSNDGDNKFEKLEAPIQLLKKWDFHSATSSFETTLAIEWAQKLQSTIQKVYIDEGEDDQVVRTKLFASSASQEDLLQPLLIVVDYLESTYGTWQVPWGDINRFQRLTGDVVQKPDDTKSSLPVPFASASWGMLPSYNSRRFEGTHKRYGVSGNSFICAVEFGPKIKAKSLLAGGQSGDPNSPHFFDQAEMYTLGKFKEVLFYREDVEKNIVRKYHPSQ